MQALETLPNQLGPALMILGIDAFNLHAGGGITHLVEMLSAADPAAHGFDQVIVWAGTNLLTKIDDRVWLRKVHEPFLDRALPYRLFWQRFRSKRLAERAGCDVLFVPGGADGSGFRPVVTMSRNMLPFERRELKRYGFSFYTLKLLLVRWAQRREFRKADSIIFLTQYAQNSIVNSLAALQRKCEIVPHGISQRFFINPRPQLPAKMFHKASPFRVLYVSALYAYKHQWLVAEAVAMLRAEGMPVVLKLVGPPAEGLLRLNATLARIDPQGTFISYCGPVPYEDLDKQYATADIGVFASTCENMPNILLEYMAAGLPIACSRSGPMPEILGDAGVYFDPEDSNSIATAIRNLFASEILREQKSIAAFERVKQYSWTRCAGETFGLLARVARKSGRPPNGR